MITLVLAVVPVTDIAAAREWYVRLLGREPDNNPMDTLVEWQLVDHGFLQVTLDGERAGTGQVNFAVDDLAHHVRELTARGIAPGDVQPVNKGVELYPVADPDGNVITFIGNFRVRY